jgi:uncharacterized protein
MARNNTASPNRAGFEFYRDASGSFRWRLRSANGNVVADSAEGYRRISGAENGARAVVQACRTVDMPAATAEGTAPAVKRIRKARAAAEQPALTAVSGGDVFAGITGQGE